MHVRKMSSANKQDFFKPKTKNSSLDSWTETNREKEMGRKVEKIIRREPTE